jgi:hypothetical protein
MMMTNWHYDAAQEREESIDGMDLMTFRREEQISSRRFRADPFGPGTAIA